MESPASVSVVAAENHGFDSDGSADHAVALLPGLVLQQFPVQSLMDVTVVTDVFVIGQDCVKGILDGGLSSVIGPQRIQRICLHLTELLDGPASFGDHLLDAHPVSVHRRDADGRVHLPGKGMIVCAGTQPGAAELARGVHGVCAELAEGLQSVGTGDPKQVDRQIIGDKGLNLLQDLNDVLGRGSDEAAQADVLITHFNELSDRIPIGLRVPALSDAGRRKGISAFPMPAQKRLRIVPRQIVAAHAFHRVLCVRTDDQVVNRHTDVEPQALIIVQDFTGLKGRIVLLHIVKCSAVPHDRPGFVKADELMDTHLLDQRFFLLAALYNDL